MAVVTREWLAYVLKHTRVDFETGEVFWAIRARGRRVGKPIGCKDSNGYIKLQIAYESCYAHQVVFLHYHGRWPEMIDHDNQVRDDNRPSNLVETDHSKNALNSKLWATNTTGVKGVSKTKDGRFKVTVQKKFYGYFETLAAAKEVANGCYN